MGIAAVPKAIGDQFDSAPPGHRFGLYLSVWKVDWSMDGNNKAEALTRIVGLPQHSTELEKRLNARQSALAARQPERVLTLEAKATAPLMTGLGNEHPLENGFSFLNPYGLPYLPGSGIKGVLLRAAGALASGNFGDTHGWTSDVTSELFGSAASDGKSETGRCGLLRFWDVIPTLEGGRLHVEVMTPHYGDYYQGKASPHDSGKPNPIMLLAVPANSSFRFHVECLKEQLPETLNDWREMVEQLFLFAFDWLGFGAKTSVGYGQMSSTKMTEMQRDRDYKDGLAASGIRVSSTLWERAEVIDVKPGSGELTVRHPERLISATGQLYSQLSRAAKDRKKKGKRVFLRVKVEELGNSIKLLSIEEELS